LFARRRSQACDVTRGYVHTRPVTTHMGHDPIVSRERSVGRYLRTGHEPTDPSLAMRQRKAFVKGGRSRSLRISEPTSRLYGSREEHAKQEADCLNPIQVRGLAARAHATTTAPST
jgi:hypothetical protein